jgi:hypothetical protein
MVEDPLFYTETMARLLVRQGKIQEAAEIYRHLLSEDGGRFELKDALAQLEKRLGGRRDSRQQKLAELFSRWIALTVRVQVVQKLGACMQPAGRRRKEVP